jgi:hypothetical protein
MYNGVPIDALADRQAEPLGIHSFAAGIFTRAILVDVPLLLGADYMEPGTAATVADLEAWEKRARVEVGSGDVLLIRTGRWEGVRRKGSWNFLESAAGSHASIARMAQGARRGRDRLRRSERARSSLRRGPERPRGSSLDNRLMVS